MRVYFDACALGRLTDATDQPRLLAESRAVEFALGLVYQAKLTWITSPFLLEELSQNPDPYKRKAMVDLLRYASETWSPTRNSTDRARTFARLGYGPVDGAHLATAEAAAADFLLTTDDRFLRRARGAIGRPLVKVVNPVEWEREVRHGNS